MVENWKISWPGGLKLKISNVDCKLKFKVCHHSNLMLNLWCCKVILYMFGKPVAEVAVLPEKFLRLTENLEKIWELRNNMKIVTRNRIEIILCFGLRIIVNRQQCITVAKIDIQNWMLGIMQNLVIYIW